MVAVALVVDLEGANWTVDRNLMKIRAAETNQLGVQVRKQSALQQRIVREVNARDKIWHAKCHLFSFREKVVRISGGKKEFVSIFAFFYPKKIKKNKKKFLTGFYRFKIILPTI